MPISEGGNSPDILFCPRYRMYKYVGKVGIVPVSLFEFKCKVSKDCGSGAGIEQVNKLFRALISLIGENNVGIHPDSKLYPTWKNSSVLGSTGIDPLNLLDSAQKLYKIVEVILDNPPVIKLL
eukprot:NODE_768_length_4387_cov_0.301772.p4 type:complete len:123 gc:universal NODE_768_length_4387_cov_0.301772:2556-2188(-)